MLFFLEEQSLANCGGAAKPCVRANRGIHTPTAVPKLPMCPVHIPCNTVKPVDPLLCFWIMHTKVAPVR